MHPVAQSALDVRVYQRGYNLVVRCFVDGELVFKDQFGGLVPVTPGRHTIRCETQGRGGYGEASLVVDVASGMTLPVFYAPPLSYVSKGALALTPQQPRGALDWSYVAWGAGFFLVLFAISLVVTLVSG